MQSLITAAIVVVLLVALLSAAIKVVPEYQRGVIFRLGRLIGAKGPGLFILIPVVDRMVKIDLRTITLDVPPQEAITKDNVPVKVNAVVYFRVLDPNKSVVEVENYIVATSQIAQTTLRSVLGQSDLDHLLTEREKINSRLQEIIDEQTDPWGVKASVVEIKDVELPVGMQRAMARQAEAERERRAKVIAAEGEFQASEKLSQAAQVLDRTPTALQLRYLQTLIEVAAEKNSTTIFPLPIDLIRPFMDRPAAPPADPGPARSE
jgi:regulator of protease activity HflC (stomatin/prohibitin superfamily)